MFAESKTTDYTLNARSTCSLSVLGLLSEFMASLNQRQTAAAALARSDTMRPAYRRRRRVEVANPVLVK